MSEWFDLFVYASLIIAFWFVLPSWSARFTLATVADRNPQWLRDHQDVAAKLSGGSRLRWLYYAWGFASLAALFSFQTGRWPRQWSPEALGMARWETLKELNTLLFLPGLVVFVGAGVLFTRWLTSTVPLVERRRATLERRTLDDFVPRWIQIAVYAAIALNLAAWLALAALGWHTTAEFWDRFLLVLVMTPIFLFFSRLSVRRPPQALDRIFGPAFRRTEVRSGLAMNLVLPVVGAFRLYEELAETVAFDVSRTMHLGLVLCVTAGILRLALFAKGQTGPDAAGPWSATSTATVLLAATLLVPSSACPLLEGDKVSPIRSEYAVNTRSGRTRFASSGWQAARSEGPRFVYRRTPCPSKRVSAKVEGSGLVTTWMKRRSSTPNACSGMWKRKIPWRFIARPPARSSV